VLSGSASHETLPGLTVWPNDRNFIAHELQFRSPVLKEEMKMSEAKKQPILRVDFYPVFAAIWRNKTAEGEAFYSATFERKYKDKEGKYHNGGNFSTSDLLLLAKAADLAHTQMLGFQESDRGATKE
jgi:hypothetical protein